MCGRAVKTPLLPRCSPTWVSFVPRERKVVEEEGEEEGEPTSEASLMFLSMGWKGKEISHPDDLNPVHFKAAHPEATEAVKR